MKTLSEQACITASMMALGERIAYGRDVELLIHLADQAEALTKERDALMSAAKLALLQMGRNQYLVRSGAPSISAERFNAAIEALRQAGVQ